MSNFLIALGANLPQGTAAPEETLARAIEAIERLPGVALRARAAFYRTPAVPAGSGPDFVNTAVALDTDLAPDLLLEALHAIEAGLGRTRPSRWAPRVCDIDMIACEDMILPDRETVAEWMALDLGAAQSVVPPRLILPHPRMQNRAFVLLPLLDIAPEWRHPVSGHSVREMVSALPPEATGGIVRLPPA